MYFHASRDESKTIEVTVTKFRTHDDYIEASWQGCEVVSKCPESHG